MKINKTILMLLCAVVIGLSVMSVSAERTVDNSQGDAPNGGLIAPGPDTTGDAPLISPAPENTGDGSQANLISPGPSGNDAATTSKSNDLLNGMGLPILGIACVIAMLSILVVVIYKKK